MPVRPGCEPFRHDGGPVGALLVHGFTGSPASMRPWGDYLGAAGLTVLGPRLPGHGTRWQDLNLTRWTDWYAEAQRGLRDLAARCDEVYVMALSMGACLSLRLAEEHPDLVRGLVLVNPSLMTLRKDAKVLPYVSRIVPSLKGIINDIKKPGGDELGYDRIPLRAAASLPDMWRSTTAGLGLVQCPTLVYRSRDDHVVEPASVELLLAQIGTSEVELRVLEESYHVATIDNDAETIFEGSLDFVRTHTALSGV
ncbi:MAG TPA: alpha/beta fold hydrolase [Mycobacteriales bacterium]|nr:alpha/beta fold hydrolase [Mycobacteriales bacterium]